jgi:hypothetical protein
LDGLSLELIDFRRDALERSGICRPVVSTATLVRDPRQQRVVDLDSLTLIA